MAAEVQTIRKPPIHMWHVYIIKCSDNSLYTGVTTNITQRIKDHNYGKGGKYTRRHLPVNLVYKEIHPTQSEALKRESEIKGWTRKKKQALIKK